MKVLLLTLLVLSVLFVASVWYLSKLGERYRKISEKAIKIVIMVKDQEPWVEGFIRKLFRLTRGMSALDILVVDDGSSDQTQEVLLRLQRTYPFNLSFACELNDLAGLREPAGSYVFDARGLTGSALLRAPVFSQLKALSAGKSPILSK